MTCRIEHGICIDIQDKMTELYDQITSVSNPLIKQLRGLERKKTRNESGLFMAEGARLVQQGLDTGWQAEVLVIADKTLDRAHIQSLAEKAAATGTRIIASPERVMRQITRKDNPGAVVAAFRQRTYTFDDLNRTGPGIWLALYEVRDPGNLGTIIRTADCAGIAGLVLIGTCCDPYSVEAVRASMGSLFDLRIVSGVDFTAFNTWRNAHGIALIAASVNGAQRHDDISYSTRTSLLMGNEQSGLPNAVEAACDHLALIPMRGGADSLNLAQATAILSYEAWRQQGYPGASI